MGIDQNELGHIISPQGRVSDHRINLTLYKLDQVMQGDLNEFIDALTADDQATKLSELNP